MLAHARLRQQVYSLKILTVKLLLVMYDRAFLEDNAKVLKAEGGTLQEEAPK